MRKPRIGIFDFACCEGCQLQIVNMEEDILQLLSVINPVEWREAMSDKADPNDRFDIAIIEGSITRDEDVEKVKKIRQRADFVIALGACATIGGVNKLKNNFGINDVKTTVYGAAADMPHLDTAPVKSVGEVIPVDHNVHGCPIDVGELARAVKALLAGTKPTVPEYPVCVECKLQENACRFEFGEICLGPITRAGCDARCPSNGTWCFGCRGFLDDANTDAARGVMAKYGKTINDLRGKMLLFNSK